MPDYQIRFCNDVANPTGHVFHTCQRELIITAPSKEAAIELGKREFERQEQIQKWSLHAASIECRKLDKPRH